MTPDDAARASRTQEGGSDRDEHSFGCRDGRVFSKQIRSFLKEVWAKVSSEDTEALDRAGGHHEQVANLVTSFVGQPASVSKSSRQLLNLVASDFAMARSYTFLWNQRCKFRMPGTRKRGLSVMLAKETTRAVCLHQKSRRIMSIQARLCLHV
eukprot:6191850-Pleurochrysis_carterae.AAC.1